MRDGKLGHTIDLLCRFKAEWWAEDDSHPERRGGLQLRRERHSERISHQRVQLLRLEKKIRKKIIQKVEKISLCWKINLGKL